MELYYVMFYTKDSGSKAINKDLSILHTWDKKKSDLIFGLVIGRWQRCFQILSVVPENVKLRFQAIWLEAVVSCSEGTSLEGISLNWRRISFSLFSTF